MQQCRRLKWESTSWYLDTSAPAPIALIEVLLAPELIFEWQFGFGPIRAIPYSATHFVPAHSEPTMALYHLPFTSHHLSSTPHPRAASSPSESDFGTGNGTEESRSPAPRRVWHRQHSLGARRPPEGRDWPVIGAMTYSGDRGGLAPPDAERVTSGRTSLRVLRCSWVSKSHSRGERAESDMMATWKGRYVEG